MSTVLLFGTFDHLHPGHDAMLRQAATLADELIVCVARDEIVEQLKGRPAIESLIQRLQRVGEHPSVARALPGDRTLGGYETLQSIDPDAVAFGYDQDALAADFMAWQARTGNRARIVRLAPFLPSVYKSSILREPVYD